MNENVNENDSFEKICELIDELTGPEKMPRDQYAEFLEELMCELQDRLDALEEETGR